jgi:hypothetical protein
LENNRYSKAIKDGINPIWYEPQDNRPAKKLHEKLSSNKKNTWQSVFPERMPEHFIKSRKKSEMLMSVNREFQEKSVKNLEYELQIKGIDDPLKRMFHKRSQLLQSVNGKLMRDEKVAPKKK